MYDSFSGDYDRFVNWEERLALELPFIERQLAALQPPPGRALRVLDAACGTGMHAIALARRGYDAAAADISAAMIERARQNAARLLPQAEAARFAVAGFGGLAGAFASRLPFDALLCLGNSLPHVEDAAHLAAALSDFAACLRADGLLILQNRNFDAVLAQRQRWMTPQSRRQGDEERIFVRFYDFESGGRITFNILTLRRAGAENWRQEASQTRLYPLLQRELGAALETAGFCLTQDERGAAGWYGSLAGEAFSPSASENLIAVARKRR